MSISTTSHLDMAPARPVFIRFAIAAACVALADWLFYGWQVGVSLAIFLGALGIAASAGQRMRAPRTVRIVMAALLLAAGLLAVVEDVGILSVTMATLATALFVIIITASEKLSWQHNLLDAVTIPLRGPFQLATDMFGAARLMKGRTPNWLRAASLIAWILPLTAFAVFLGLLASANPLIEYWLKQIDLRVLSTASDPQRTGFWIIVLCAIWPLILRRVPRLPVWEPEPRAFTAPSDQDHLFGAQAVTRSLILFNGLFALQSALDLTYLWGGMNLPDGMSHAEYAHRGAYPLIVTALLAAAFVLIAMRPGGPAEHSRLIRPLVLAWIGQNVLLVASSIFRLDLYVGVYSLTYLRLAAFIWMGLVAAGLLLMLIQIALRKSNSWLVAANAASLGLVLYGCCFINAPRLVASYNVEHCREAGGTGPNLDLPYLVSLGPQALPSVETYVKKVPVLWSTAWDYRHTYETRMRPGNWRAQSFRTWRLERYLANNPSIPSNLSDSGRG